ncbi:MAG TPA: response regulator [Pyrinomonadaceae bacterium]|nr:response regulator [Pyrinomonadaceae bacterium]
MKVLIGYDGSPSAEAALEDLRRAGLPREGAAVVVAVGELAAAPDMSAADALGSFRRFRPDVLVSDIRLPYEDGYQLIEKVRALGEDEGGGTPSAALTACARAEDRERALRSGFQLHLPKPADPDELCAAVAALAGRAAKS